MSDKDIDKHISLLSVIFLAIAVLFGTYAVASEDKGDSGPLPRFASLRASEVNMRVGPGTRYAIKWVYKDEGLPVEITQVFNDWREVRDSDGTVGWIHKEMLQSKRNAVIKKNIGVLRKSPEENGPPIVRVEPGVVGKLLECKPDWCKIQVAGHKGWIEKTSIWGVDKNEKF